MKIYLTDQTHKFPLHLERLKKQPVMAYERSALREKVSTIEVNVAGDLSGTDLSWFFNYEIFPQNILNYKTQWQAENRGMRVGDTIMQQVFLPPHRIFSQKIIFGVRINEIIDTPDKKGFSYETLEGHVEKGISTFTIEKAGKDAVFRIHTFSKPGNLLSTLLGPVFSVPYQAFCTRAALKNVKQRIDRP